VQKRVQGVFCVGQRYSISCDNPDQVMWIGDGVNWGVKSFDAPQDESCIAEPTDCIENVQLGQYATVSRYNVITEIIDIKGVQLQLV